MFGIMGVEDEEQEEAEVWIQEPSEVVASGLFQISTAVSSFRHLLNALGTPMDTPLLRQKLHKARLRIGQLVKNTLAQLKQVSEADHSVEVAKMVNSQETFEALLNDFQKAQRLAAERETLYAPLVPKPQPLLRLSSYTVDDGDKTPEQQALLVESTRHEVHVVPDYETAVNEAILIDEREQGIQEIQQQIGQVKEIYKDLSSMFFGQGTMIYGNIEGKSTLLKAPKTGKRSNSSLTCLVLVMFGIVLLILIIVLTCNQLMDRSGVRSSSNDTGRTYNKSI